VVRRILSLTISTWVGLVGLLVRASGIADADRLFVVERYEEAIGAYENVASGEDRKEAAEALFGIGRAHQMLARWELARDSFQKLLREYPDSELAPVSKIQLGQCEIKLGNLAKALAIFKEIEELHAGHEAAIEATYNIANLDAGFFGSDARNARAAIRGYNRVLDSALGRRYAIQSFFGLGQCYMLLGDYRRAIESFRAVIEKGPDTLWANYAREQVANVIVAFGNLEASKKPRDQQPWPFDRSLPDYFQIRERFAWHFAAGRPALRVYAIGFFTEPPKDGSAADKVFYSSPTIHYKNYIFNSERGTVDRLHRWVECTGNVSCTDDAIPPTLTITSGALTLDLTKDAALFSRNVSFEKRSAGERIQQLMVEELHLMLDSGKIEIPPAKSE